MSKLEIGQTVADRYLLTRKLGKGGMGEVFLATDTSNGQEVALKTLHAQFMNNNYALARFVREVNTAYQLHHPGIVKIYDACQWQNIMFYTMEYVEGKSLRHWMNQRGKLKLDSVVRILCLVADALSHAHHLTIHRDLSPENIMVLKRKLRHLFFDKAILQAFPAFYSLSTVCRLGTRHSVSSLCA